MRREAGANLFFAGACSKGGEVEGNFHAGENRPPSKGEQSCEICNCPEDFPVAEKVFAPQSHNPLCNEVGIGKTRLSREYVSYRQAGGKNFQTS